MMNLPSSWDLPPEIKSRFGQKSLGKQRAMIAQNHLLLVLHKPPEANQRQREVALFWRQPDGTWKQTGLGNGIEPLIRHLKEYNAAAEKFIAAYQQAQEAEDYFRILEAMSPLRLATKNLHATLQAAREGVPGDRDLIDLRDYAYEIERSLDLLYENTKNALDFRIAQRAEEQAKLSLQAVKAGEKLNILAAMFFPLTAITSVFGMNLVSGLENNSIATFWLIVFVGIALGIFVVQWSRLTRSKEEKVFSPRFKDHLTK